MRAHIVRFIVIHASLVDRGFFANQAAANGPEKGLTSLLLSQFSIPSIRRCALAFILLWPAAPLAAQDDRRAQTDAPDTPAPGEPQPKLVFEPDYFARFAPRSALDMVDQIPGFIVQGGGEGRGLGQANENVLINGQRLSSKSDSARDQLGRIPADKVVRIEIVDGISLEIPGLTGQVANIVVDSDGISGQFEWEGAFRPTSVDPEWYGGEISLSGKLGKLDFTAALANNNNRFGADGPVMFRNAAGAVIETRTVDFVGAFDVPRISGAFGYDFGGDVVANLNLSWERTVFDRREAELRQFPAATDIFRDNVRTGGSPEYEISGDITFPLGPGRLKLIGLENYDGEASDDRVIDTPRDGSLATGSRFTQNGSDGERIGRFEYSWGMWSADWQLAGEAAFNRLDRVSRLFELAPDGRFIELDFTEGTGGVTEDRYETILSFSRRLTKSLSLQATAGAEFSTLTQTGSAANSRSFQRPKGSVSLAWQPGGGLDISLEVLREVGQLSFRDFLARVNLDAGNGDAGNNALVPDQSWGVDLEINKTLGAFGSSSLKLQQRWIEDYIDRIPLAGGGESRGNIDSAKSTEITWSTTFRLDSLGIRGAQLDVEANLFASRVRDPFDGQFRAFSNAGDRNLDVDFRHDIPRTSLAYGGGLRYSRTRPVFRLSEISREIEGPTFANLFIEHKNVFGLTVRGTYANILGGREREDRTVFTGPRTDGVIAFTENRNLRIGPIFRFTVTGNF